MNGLRRYIRTQACGRALAVTVAYALAIQALMASVGLAMSAGVAPGQAGFVICSVVSNPGAPAPADDRDSGKPTVQCPFCFVTAQGGGQLATLGSIPAHPAYAALPIAGPRPSDRGESRFIPQLLRSTGNPRGPPGSLV